MFFLCFHESNFYLISLQNSHTINFQTTTHLPNFVTTIKERISTFAEAEANLAFRVKCTKLVH